MQLVLMGEGLTVPLGDMGLSGHLPDTPTLFPKHALLWNYRLQWSGRPAGWKMMFYLRRPELIAAGRPAPFRGGFSDTSHNVTRDLSYSPSAFACLYLCLRLAY